MKPFQRPGPIPGPDMHLGVVVPDELKRDWSGDRAQAWQWGVQAAQRQAYADSLEPGPRVKPTVGRTVHYVSHGTPVREDGTQAFTKQCRAAIVTEVLGDPEAADTMVNLAVFNPQGLFFDHATMHSEDVHDGGTWHWPEHEDGE